MIDLIRHGLTSLSIERPLFYKEPDFQLSYGCKLREVNPDAKVRLEFPVHLDTKIDVDLFVYSGGLRAAVELKYKTQGFVFTHDQEEYRLANQAAENHSRYDFCRDVERLETVVRAKKADLGYAIILTNNSRYWNSNEDSSTKDAHFRLHEGRSLNGTLSWGEWSYGATLEKKGNPVVIRGSYLLRWHDYSRLSAKAGGRFRYTIVEVLGGGA